MNRRPAPLPKSPLNCRRFLRRNLPLLTLPLLAAGQSASAADTQYNVKNGSTDLTATATYTTGGTSGTGAGGAAATTGPSVTSDVLFDSGVAYSPAAFTLNTSQTFGSLNDLSTTALTIANAGSAADTLTLGGMGFLGDGVIGSASTDLLFVGNGATLTLTGGTGTTALGLVLGQSGNFDVVGTATISSIISGSGFGITKTGVGTLTLSGANTFSGGLTIAAGTVQVGSGSATALGASTGAVNLGASSGTASAIINNNGGSNFTFANAINVNAGSTGTLEIEATSGAPTLSGLVTLSNNLLLVNTNSSGSNSLNLTGGIAGTGNVTFSATNAAGSVISGTALTFTGTLANTSTGGAGFGISANLTGAESLLQNSATSITTLSGTNTNTGTDTSAVGVLDFAKPASLFNGVVNATTTNLIVLPGATAAFQVGASNFTAANIATLNALGSSSGGFENGSLLGIDTTPSAFTYATALTNSNGGANAIGLNKLGANTLTLTGTNTYTGPTVVTAGTLQISGTGTLGGGTYAASISDAGTLEYSSSTAQTLSGSIGGAGGLTKDTGAGTLTLSGVNTFTGATAVTAGTLDVANALALQNGAVGFTAPGAITFDSAVTSNAFTFGGLTANANNNYVLQNTAGTAITLQIGNPLTNVSSATLGVFSGAGGLTAAGFSNTLTLVGANTYTGATTVTGSTLNLGNATASGSIGTGSNALVLGGFASGGLFNYTRTGTVAQSFASTSLGAGENAVTTSTGTQTLNLGAISAGGGATLDINPNTTSAITTSNTANVNGILGGYATYGGKTTWAVAPATAGGAITGLAAGAYTPSATAGTTPANYLNANVDVTASATPTGAITPNSVRFNTATAYTLTLTGVNVITSGGILQTAAATAGGTITGGTITGSAGGLLDVTNGSGSATLSLNSLIVDNGATPTAVAVSGSVNGGYVAFNNVNNSFSGGLYFNGGRLSFTSGGTAFGTGNVTFGNQVYTNSGGGGINFSANSVTSGLLVDAQGTNSSNGDISSGGGAGNWTLIGTGTASFAGIIGNYASGRVVNLTLDSGTQIIANTQLGSSAVTVNGGTMQVGNGYVGAYSNSANNVALQVGGGTFVEYGNLAGTTSQPFNSGLVVNAGASTVTALNNSGAGTLVSFGAAGSRAVGGTVNFVLPTGAQSALNGFTTVNLNVNGILGGYATVGGTDWATNATNTAGGNIVAYTGYTNDTFSAGTNTNVTTSDAFAAGSTNSIRFNTAGASVVTQTGTGIVTSGGILVTPNVGANALSITGGTLEGASGADLVVIQNDATAGGGLTIGSIIANNTTATGLTKSGAGLLTLTGTNTYTGGTFLNGGVLNAATTNIDGGSATNGITFNGGTLQAATGGITTGKAVVIGATGGTIDTNGNAVTLSGVVSGTPSAGAGALGGFNSTGAFAFTKVGAGTLTLSNIANTFGGGLVINNGTVADGSASGTGTFGTGYVTFGNNANTPTMSLGSRSVTVAGLIGAGSNGVVTGGVAGTPVLTLDGVSTQTFGGVISNGVATSVGLTLNLNNPTESQILTNANTYTGTTTITAGALQLGNGTAGNDGTIGSASIVDNAALAFNYASTATTPGVISGTGTVTKTGAGTAVLTAANTFTGATTITAGTLQLGNGGTAGALAPGGVIVNNGNLTINRSNAAAQGTDFSTAAITGTGSFTQAGAGTTTLTAANTFTGATTVSGGTLALAAAGGPALGGTSAIAVNNGTLMFGQTNQVNAAAPITVGTASTTGTLSVGAAGFSQGAGATVASGASSGTSTQGLGALTLNNNATLNYGGAGTTLVFGAFTSNNNSVLTVNGYNNATYDGVANSGVEGTDDRLIFNQTGGLTAAQLADISFGAGDTTTELQLGAGSSFYEIGFSSVPEPATCWGGLLVVASGVWQYRRQRRGSRV